MIELVKESQLNIDKKTHIKKINETDKMLSETLRIINNYKKKILDEKKNTSCF